MIHTFITTLKEAGSFENWINVQKDTNPSFYQSGVNEMLDFEMLRKLGNKSQSTSQNQ